MMSERIRIQHVPPSGSIDGLMPYIVLDAEDRVPHTVRATSYHDAIERYGKPVHNSGRLVSVRWMTREFVEDGVPVFVRFIFSACVDELIEMADALGWDRTNTLWLVEDGNFIIEGSRLITALDLRMFPSQSLTDH